MKRTANWIAHAVALALTCFTVGCAPIGDGPDEGPRTEAEQLQERTAALAAIDCESEYRHPSVDWTEYFRACAGRVAARTATTAAPSAATVYDSRVSVANANFAAIPAWTNAQIRAQFRSTRDTRFLYSVDDASFQRRCSWLYPDDGCFARSELAASRIGDAGLPKPYKLFSFGNLSVTTTNNPNGYVTWGWHVVPVVKSSNDGQIYVLDPAIDPSRPMPWQTWLLRQVPALTQVQVTVADPNAYNYQSPVTGGANQRALATQQLQQTYLPYEWSRQIELSRDPTLVLGNSPPWRVQRAYMFGVDGVFAAVSSCQTCTGDAHALTTRCFTHCP